MSRTIRELIAELSANENLDQPIVAQWSLAEDFEYADGTPTPTPEQFGEIIAEIEYGDVTYDELNDIVYEVMRKFVCSQCDEPCSKQEIENHEGLCMDCNEIYGEGTND
jgi:hypothetical protein